MIKINFGKVINKVCEPGKEDIYLGGRLFVVMASTNNDLTEKYLNLVICKLNVQMTSQAYIPRTNNTTCLTITSSYDYGQIKSYVHRVCGL